MGIKGYATLEGTKGYFEKKGISSEKFKSNNYFTSLPVAMGTYLGDFSDEDSLKYEESLTYGLEKGINFIDTAICYRGMRSEKDVGKVLRNLVAEKFSVKRDEIIISTKAGIIFGDITIPMRPADYLENILIKKGIVNARDINVTDEFRHTLNPKFYEYAIEKSKKNLGIDTIDIHYIHEPEASKSVIGADDFYYRLVGLFEFYENQVEKGNIMNYGMATWSGFIAEENSSEYISLEKVIEVAKNVAGEKHHFKFVQLNYNKINTTANVLRNQKIKDKYCTAIEAANELGIIINVNGPLNQMKDLNEKKYSTEEMIRFVLNTKGVYAAMVGNKQIEHLKDNMKVIV